MSMRQSLQLDHFYINASPEDFEAFLKLKDVIKTGVRHEVVKADGDEWEGLYIYSRPGSYFEILKDRRPNSLGLAFQVSSPLTMDPAEIMTELPLKWNVFSREMNGQKWFDALSTASAPFTRETLFDAWIMKYYQRKTNHKGPKLPRTLDQFQSIELTLGREHVESIRTLSDWFPGSREINSAQIHFQVPNQDGWPFDVRIDLVDGSQRFEFKKLVFDVYDVESLPDFTEMQLGSFKLMRQNDRLVLTR